MVVKNGKVNKLLIMMIVVVAVFVINIGHPLALHDTFTNYYGVEMTNEEYVTLLNLGFLADEIYYMTEETFEENKDLDASLVASNTKYYKTVVPMYGLSYSVEVTPQEYLNQGDAQILGTLTTYYRQEVSTIAANGSTKYRYKLSTMWLNWPSVASYDIMAIGFVNSVYISSNNVFFNYVYMDDDGTHTSTVWYDRKKTEFGGSVVYKMPSNVVSLSSQLYFDVKKNTNDTLTSLTMCADYAHALNSVTQSQAANHGISSGGIVHDASVVNYYDATDCCYATITGINW
jgi:hypothetical protein